MNDNLKMFSKTILGTATCPATPYTLGISRLSLPTVIFYVLLEVPILYIKLVFIPISHYTQ